MFKKLFYIILLSFYLLTCKTIYKTNDIPKEMIQKEESIKKTIPVDKINQQNKKVETVITKNSQKTLSTSIGSLIIPKISLKNDLYPIGDKNNNIEKNVTILYISNEPTENNSIIFIAAHSGTGKIAYFKNLDKLELEDQIILNYKNKTYTYKVENIWETPKTGNINVEKTSNNQLVLTTCSPSRKNYQLIINSTQIEKES